MRKSKIYGIVGTTIFAVLMLLLFLFVRIESMQDSYNEPIVVNLGDSEDGVGAAVPNPAPPTAPLPVQPASHKEKAQPQNENLATQADESPITAVEKKKPTVTKPTAHQLEENRRKIQNDLLQQEQAKEEAVKQAQIADKARKMGSVFGSNHGTGSGDGQSGSGIKGNPLGKVGGTGVSVSVAGRTVTLTPSPAYNSNDEGKVTVNVTVDKDGNVTRAYIGSATTTSETLRDAAIQAARRSKFSTGTNEAIGTITYRFILK